MADTPPVPTSSDNETALQTLQFLGRQLQLHRFILRGQVKKRLAGQAEEALTRNLIKGLILRIQREIDRNPNMFKRFVVEDGNE